MPYFEFMMLIDEWIDEIEEQKKIDKKRSEESERERKRSESSRKKNTRQKKVSTPKMPKSMKPKF